jgi:hypothetical protein
MKQMAASGTRPIRVATVPHTLVLALGLLIDK